MREEDEDKMSSLEDAKGSSVVSFGSTTRKKKKIPPAKPMEELRELIGIASSSSTLPDKRKNMMGKKKNKNKGRKRPTVIKVSQGYLD